MNRDEVIIALFDAAIDPALWPAALERLARWTSMRSINLETFDLRSTRGNVSAQFGFDARYVDAYNNDATAANALAEAASRQVGAGDIRTSSQLMLWKDYQRSELFQMMLRPNGVRHVAGVTLEASAEAIAYVSFNKPDDADDFSDREIARLARLQPWLRRACAIHRRLSATENRLAQLTSMWDQVHHAVFLLDRRAYIHFANRAAEMLLRWRVAIVGNNGCLLPIHPQSRAALSRALSVRGPLTGAAGVFRLRRSEPESDLTATLFPVTDGLIGLLISDPARLPELSPDSLRQLFDLTPAEARLVLALVHGQSLKNYAESEGLVYATVRTHLKHAMEKNGWRRQSEMVAMIMRCLTPLGEPVSK